MKLHYLIHSFFKLIADTEMMGPVYNIPENVHHFNEILKHVSDLKQLAGPVYDCNREHTFREVQGNLEKLTGLQGPVFDINRLVE